MRARDFIIERGPGRITKRQRWGTRGVHVFQDKDGRDRFNELNRVMMAAAVADGETPIDVDSAAWYHNHNLAFPYSDVEHEMLKQAYDAIGSKYKDINNGDLRSQEPPGGNTKSPVQGFRGYPR